MLFFCVTMAANSYGGCWQKLNYRRLNISDMNRDANNTNGYKYSINVNDTAYHVNAYIYSNAIINVFIITPQGHVPVVHIDCMRPTYAGSAEFSRTLCGRAIGTYATAGGRIVAFGDYAFVKVAGNITETTLARLPRSVLMKAFRWISCYLFVMGPHAWVPHDTAAEESSLIMESLTWFQRPSDDEPSDVTPGGCAPPPGFEYERYYGGVYLA